MKSLGFLVGPMVLWMLLTAIIWCFLGWLGFTPSDTGRFMSCLLGALFAGYGALALGASRA